MSKPNRTRRRRTKIPFTDRKTGISDPKASTLPNQTKPISPAPAHGSHSPTRPLRGMRRGVLPIIFEDDDILVVNKPAGLLTSTVPRERRATLLAMVREHVESAYRRGSRLRARVGVIHRLDRDASGLLVFSKNNDAYVSLKRQFFHHDVERIYSVIVHGVPTPRSGKIESRLLELPDGRVVTTRQHAKGQLAVTEYEVIEVAKPYSLLRVRLHTGRKHQIRSHLAQRGTPVVNDAMYDPARKPAGRLMLAATELGITHPGSSRRLTFRIDLPNELRALINPPAATRAADSPAGRKKPRPRSDGSAG